MARQSKDHAGMPISELQMIGFIKNALKIPRTANTFREVMADLDECPEIIAPPFHLAGVRWVPERLAVLREVLNPRRSRLISYLEETPDSVLLVSDVVESGGASLHFVTSTDSTNKVLTWMSSMAPVRIVVNEFDSRLIMTAPFSVFYRGE